MNEMEIGWRWGEGGKLGRGQSDEKRCYQSSLNAHACAKTTLSLKRGRELKYPFIFSSFRRNRSSVAESEVELSVEQRAGVSQTYTHLDVVLTS